MFRGAYGGRGSAKTRSFAKMAAVRAMMWATEGREASFYAAASS
jgi:phage terminase large subunit